jgi:hypothetical protein
MIGSWEVPSIERIATLEQRRLAVLPVPGLAGDLHHDLGSASLTVEIVGSVHGDAARDELLEALRAPFVAGEPLDFVADITTATELEQVVIESLEVAEGHHDADAHYRIVLRQYVEPPPPPTPIDDLGAGLLPELDALAGLGLDGMELPGLVGDLPNLADPTPPVREALSGVAAALQPLSGMLDSLREKIA